MSRAAVVLPLAAMLAACAMGPRPPIPAAAQIPVADGWRAGTTAMAAAAVPDRLWISFGDPVLSALVDAALAANDDVAVAAARVVEARALLRVTGAQQFSSLDARADAARSRSVSAFGLPQEQSAAEPQLVASYDLDLFGRLAAATASARASLLATAAARDAVRLAVAGTAVTAYINLRALDDRLTITRDTLTARREALRVAGRRARTGYTSDLELRQAEAEYRAAEQLVPQVQLAIARQEDALNVLLGRAPADITRGASLAEMRTPVVPINLPSQVLRSRPDIAQAEQSLVAADQTLDSARAAFLPSIRLSAAAGAAFSTLVPNPISLWSIGGSVLAPIFAGGRLRGQADAAAARRDQAAFAYRRMALNAFREVEDALAAAQRSQEQLVALTAQRDALAAGLKLAKNRYDAGYSPYLDQLDAERGLLNAEFQVVQARTDRLDAAVALYQATGGGWRP